MNNDLISREALKKALHNFFDGKVINEPAYILRDVFCYIDGAPTVELFCSYLSDGEVRQPCVEGPCEQDRPQGEWVVKSNGTTNYYACNKCGNAGDIQDKFCRECGADMRGDKE